MHIPKYLEIKNSKILTYFSVTRFGKTRFYDISATIINHCNLFLAMKSHGHYNCFLKIILLFLLKFGGPNAFSYCQDYI